MASSSRSPITTHVLDTTKGHPVGGLPVNLYIENKNGSWDIVSNSKTDTNGRCEDLLSVGYPFTEGRFKIRFDVDKYFLSTSTTALYPTVEIIFHVQNKDEHYHLPLLLNPFGYSTYRGS